MSEVVFSTVHGSRLYGFAHEGSDHDVFVVTDSHSRRVKHTITPDGIDTTEIGIWRFLQLALSGSHQSVEAVFSPVKVWGPAGDRYRSLIAGIQVGGPEVFDKYERTIRKFCYGDYKKRRHAARLYVNLIQLRRRSSITPALDPELISFCDIVASTLSGDDLARELDVYKPKEASA
ncbi:hypothetical protein M2390_002582 [Mycetocola sp. BIGb0189]|uniref:nucleotidyltransferase domain-containing protein n=1 Tax=Mycetocola sp. BIGb0189 TaxID=2940604 RepID=UPI0021672811|nr:nucleotidyltransferase domain-containing protein [Mycetocola sp. BIGb0189]MCS4277376.1 hypothetical protein [Mycetocola sp. BIGb0189]